MNAITISIGDEIVGGQVLDTNAAWLAGELRAVGYAVIRHVSVGDDTERIAQAVREALDEAELVVATGGLGPTPDDRTREGVAAAIHQPLETDRAALEALGAWFARLERPFTDSDRRQAMIPRGCALIPNARGTAPGILYRKGAATLLVLPGVPGEMKAMFRQAVRGLPGAEPSNANEASKQSGRSICLLSFGLSEARVGESLADMMVRGRNPSVGTTADSGVIGVRIAACSGGADEARRLVEADADEIRRRLGRSIFGAGDDTLHGVVGDMLRRRGLTLATAESCTGGLLAKRFTDIGGSSAYFLCGHITYSNPSKTAMLGVASELIEQHGAVSESVAKAMAEGCRGRAGSDFALAITGIAGPGGGTDDKPVGLVFIALADRSDVSVRRILLGSHLTRGEIRDRACKVAQNMLRLRLMKLEG